MRVIAIVDACKKFRHYLYSRKFKIRTDYRPLIYLNNCKDPSSPVVRWRFKLHDYDYVIVYKKVVLNGNADSLSRIVYDKENTQLELRKEEHSKTRTRHPYSKNGKNYCIPNKTFVIPLETDFSNENLHLDYVTKNFPKQSTYETTVEGN